MPFVPIVRQEASLPVSQPVNNLLVLRNKSGHAFWWRVEMALLTSNFPLAILAPKPGCQYLFFLSKPGFLVAIILVYFIFVITQTSLIYLAKAFVKC